MLPITNKSSHFSDSVLRALGDIESGGRDTATFAFIDTAAGKRETLTAFGIWNGAAYSWRMYQHHGGFDPRIDNSTELLAGSGQVGEAARAAARLCWAMGALQSGGGEWVLIDLID